MNRSPKLPGPRRRGRVADGDEHDGDELVAEVEFLSYAVGVESAEGAGGEAAILGGEHEKHRGEGGGAEGFVAAQLRVVAVEVADHGGPLLLHGGWEEPGVDRRLEGAGEFAVTIELAADNEGDGCFPHLLLAVSQIAEPRFGLWRAYRDEAPVLEVEGGGRAGGEPEQVVDGVFINGSAGIEMPGGGPVLDEGSEGVGGDHPVLQVRFHVRLWWGS